MAKVLVNFIQDRSGSMSDCWDETVNGFKEFVKSLRNNQEGTEYLFSLTTFDTQIDTPIIAQPIANVDLDALKGFGPRGGTALYDATGTTIKNIEGDRHGAEKIIVVIVTDGHENSSREWTKDGLHASIEAKLNAGDWTFTYLGTQPETWDDAHAIGVPADSSANYTKANMSKAYGVMGQSVNSFSASPMRSTRKLVSDYTTKSARMSAGMTGSDDLQPPTVTATATVTKPVQPPKPPKPPVKSTKRWK